MTDLKLVLTEEEWKASMPAVTRDMTEYLARYRTPVFKDQRDHGEGWGSGSFVEVDGSKYNLQCSGLRLRDVYKDREPTGTRDGDVFVQTWAAVAARNKEARTIRRTKEDT